MATYRILHVSDVHFGCDKRAEMPRSAVELVKAAHRHVEKHKLQPDVCVFSGDLAYSGEPEQFAIGEKWLRSLVEPWDCRVFIVPGNHDVRRPRKDAKEGQDLAYMCRDAGGNADFYHRQRENLGKAPLMEEFFQWHEAAKPTLNLVSDWSGSRIACRHPYRQRGIDVLLVGLNTALLSCGDDDKGKLVVDETELNEMLKGSRHEEQLIIVVSHHPIGTEVGSKKQRWLASWNDREVEQILLQASGPHIYLYGHLHHAEGVSFNYTTGQNLALFGAGASYDHNKNYPMHFAFYEIDLDRSMIKPTVYEYHRDRGQWIEDQKRGDKIRTILPRPRAVIVSQASERLAELKDVMREFVVSHVELGKILRDQLPRLAPDLETILSPGVRRQMLEQQNPPASAYLPLLNEIDDELAEAKGGGDSLRQVRECVSANNIAEAILLLKRLRSYPRLLLTAQVLSKDSNDWDEAHRLLEELGRPLHYLKLGRLAWVEEDMRSAVSLLEAALRRAESGRSLEGDDVPLHRVWNDLAFYYAEAGMARKRDDALRLARDAEQALRPFKDEQPERYAYYLDTLGFVRIVFAQSKDEVLGGVQLCEDARRGGGLLPVYFNNIFKAQQRLREFAVNDSTRPA
jgi:predicted MPP superfamily phosphohydrolase